MPESSGGGVAPSSSMPESSSGVSPSSLRRSRRIITRSKPRPLPILDASLSISVASRGGKIQEMLREQHRRVRRNHTPMDKDIDVSKIKITYLPRLRHTGETRTRELAEIGVIFSTGKYKSKQTPEEELEYAESKKIATVFDIVAKNIKLPHKVILEVMSLSRMLYNTLISRTPLWRSLDLYGMDKAGNRLVAALSMIIYYNLEHINLAYAEDIEDKHLKLLTTKKEVVRTLGYLESLNLDGCQNISNTGVKHITSACPRLKKFSISGNLRVTDFCIKSLVKNCKCLTDLNLKGCKNLTDNSLVTIGNNCHLLESLDIARCEQVTDAGVVTIAGGCPGLKFLSLCGIPCVTDRCLKTLFGPLTRIISDITYVDPVQF